MPKAYSYLRFSTPEQMRGDSFRRQTQLARDYAIKSGLDLDEALTFKDLGVSAFRGRNVQKGQLQEFLRAVEVGLVEPGSYLLVENLDRISREAAWDAVHTLRSLVKAGITVVTLMDEREYSTETLTSDPMALLLAVLTFTRANEESAVKARRLRAVWESKRAQAATRPLTARVPGWLELDHSAETIRVNKKRAKVVRRIFDLTLEGFGQHKIAEILNQEGVPTFGRASCWHRSYVVKILKNSAVIGTLTPHKVEYVDGKRLRIPLDPIKGYYPAIVDEETFHRVQTVRKSRTPRRGRHASGTVRNLFGGISRCPYCGGTMTLVNKGTKGGLPFMVCAAAKMGAECVYHGVRYKQIEDAFLQDLGWLLDDVPAGNGGDAINKQVEETAAAIDGVKDEIERILNAIQQGQSPSLAERLRTLEDGLDGLEATRKALLDRQEEIMGPLVRHRLDDLDNALATDPMDRQKVNVLLRELLDAVIVDYPDGILRFQWKHGGESQVTFGWPKEDS